MSPAARRKASAAGLAAPVTAATFSATTTVPAVQTPSTHRNSRIRTLPETQMPVRTDLRKCLTSSGLPPHPASSSLCAPEKVMYPPQEPPSSVTMTGMSSLGFSGVKIWATASPTGGFAMKATTSMTTIIMPPRIWATLPTMSFAFLERKMQIASTPPMMTPAFSGMPIMALKPSDTPPTLPILNARPPSTTSTTRRYPRPGRTLLAIS